MIEPPFARRSPWNGSAFVGSCRARSRPVWTPDLLSSWCIAPRSLRASSPDTALTKHAVALEFGGSGERLIGPRRRMREAGRKPMPLSPDAAASVPLTAVGCDPWSLSLMIWPLPRSPSAPPRSLVTAGTPARTNGIEYPDHSVAASRRRGQRLEHCPCHGTAASERDKL